MSFVEINEISERTTTVDYMGGRVDLPAHHNWVAVQSTNGKSLVLSFIHKPEFTDLGWQSKGEYRVLGEVTHISFEDAVRTLRKVGNMSIEDCILSNAEELAHKIAAVISSDVGQEEKITGLFHAKTGLFAEFHAYQDGLLVDKVAKEKDLAEKRANANRLAKLELDRKNAEAAYAAEVERQNPKPQEPTESEGCDCGLIGGEPTPVEFKTEGKPRVRLVGVIGSPIGLF